MVYKITILHRSCQTACAEQCSCIWSQWYTYSIVVGWFYARYVRKNSNIQDLNVRERALAYSGRNKMLVDCKAVKTNTCHLSIVRVSEQCAFRSMRCILYSYNETNYTWRNISFSLNKHFWRKKRMIETQIISTNDWVCVCLRSPDSIADVFIRINMSDLRTTNQSPTALHVVHILCVAFEASETESTAAGFAHNPCGVRENACERTYLFWALKFACTVRTRAYWT